MKKILFTAVIALLCSFNSSAQILWQTDFATGDKTQGSIISQAQVGAQSWGYNIVSADSIGKVAARLEVRRTDPDVALSKRVELYFPKTLWFYPLVKYYMTEFTQPVWQGNDPKPEINFQMTDSADIVVELAHIGNKYELWQHFNYDGDSDRIIKHDVCFDTAGLPNRFVLHFEPAIDGAGIIELFRNGYPVYLTNGRNELNQPIGDVGNRNTYMITGPNSTADMSGPTPRLIGGLYFKTGEYKYSWKQVDPGTYTIRVVFVSAVGFGGAATDWRDFYPAPVLPPVVPTPGGGVILTNMRPVKVN